MQKDEVVEFIEGIKDPERLLEHCKKFHEKEPRDIAYVVSRNIISSHPNDANFILAGAKVIIISWNTARSLRLKSTDKEKLEDHILTAYKSSEEKLKELQGKRLESLDLSDNKLKEDIKDIFLEFSSKKSIGFTGASKILHVINPHVFMMWDLNIRRGYHKLHKRNHRIGDSECYFEFLKQSQEIIRAILSKRDEDDLWKEHLKFLDRSFMKAFSFSESVLKMLDECNYVRFNQKR